MANVNNFISKYDSDIN